MNLLSPAQSFNLAPPLACFFVFSALQSSRRQVHLFSGFALVPLRRNFPLCFGCWHVGVHGASRNRSEWRLGCRGWLCDRRCDSVLYLLVYWNQAEGVDAASRFHVSGLCSRVSFIRRKWFLKVVVGSSLPRLSLGFSLWELALCYRGRFKGAVSSLVRRF